MGVFQWNIEWKRTTDKEHAITITDCITASINKSTEIKNNLCNLTLKNSPTKIANDDTIIGDYIEADTKTIMFDEEDEVRVWADYIDDASKIGTEWWTDDELLGAFAVEEYNIQTTDNQSRIQLKAIDVAYLIFNKIYTFSYGVSNNFTSPGIIRQASRKFGEAGPNTVEHFTGTDNDSGTNYAINAKFVSEGGYITDRRSTTTKLNGAINSTDTTITVDSTSGFESTGDGTLVIDSEHIAYTGTTATTFTGCTRAIDDTVAASHSDNEDVYQGFPLILMSKIWKPLFEWIGEVSQVENTNYSSENQEGGTKFYGRAFLFWIDKNNSPHWVYPDDTVDLTITLGEEGRRSFRLDKSVFDAVNFIIYNCGEDMYGNGIIYYLYDQTSDVASLKMRYQPMSKIVHTLINDDIEENPTRDTTNQDIFKQFPASYAPAIVPSFLDDANNFRALNGDAARTNVTSDATYNDCLREACKWRGRQEAQKITSKRSGLRYKGQIAIKGTHINPGDLIEVTNPFVGLNSQYLRVTEVSHKINGNNWETTLQVEEDEKTL